MARIPRRDGSVSIRVGIGIDTRSRGAASGNILVPISNHYALYHLGNCWTVLSPGAATRRAPRPTLAPFASGGDESTPISYREH